MGKLTVLAMLLAGAAAGQSETEARLLSAIRGDDRSAIKSLLASGANPNARDGKGATALMHATLYASEECMKLLLDKGAEVNARTKAGSTALMWATAEEGKVRLLLSRGADRTMKNEAGQTALHLAVRRPGNGKVVRLLAAPGQDVEAVAREGTGPVDAHYFDGGEAFLLSLREVGIEPVEYTKGGISPLFNASFLGGEEMVRGMVEAGANPKEAVRFATLEVSAVGAAAYAGKAANARVLLASGAPVNEGGSRGFTPLMMAAGAERPNEEMVRLLLQHGANLKSRDEEGRTALDWALTRGENGIAKMLREAGGKRGAPGPDLKRTREPWPAREAMAKAVALLQPISPTFFKKTGCISCHNNSLPAMAVKLARDRKVRVDEELAEHPTKASLAMWSPKLEDFQVGIGSIGGLVANVSYGLTGMAMEGAAANAVTDALALCLARYQAPDGSWGIPDIRPPLSGTRIQFTALVIRGAGAYMPPGRKGEWKGRVEKAAAYLRKAEGHGTGDEAFRMLGLKWAGAGAAELGELGKRLSEAQKPDGGWSQLPGMESDAYATGQVMYALHSAGGMQAVNPVYQNGVRYLLSAQLDDGSWFVRRRSFGFQPYFDSGFPHGKDQFISAAATSWAVMALSAAALH